MLTKIVRCFLAILQFLFLIAAILFHIEGETVEGIYYLVGVLIVDMIDKRWEKEQEKKENP